MNNKIPFVVFGLVLVLALLGGVWQIPAFAQLGTVAAVAPTAVAFQPVIPITGGNCVSNTAIKGKPVSVNLSGAAESSALADVLNAGQVLQICPVKSADLPENTVLNPTGGAIYVSVLDSGKEVKLEEAGKKHTVVFILTASEIELFKKFPAMGILWFDPVKNEWVRLTGVLKDGKLMVDNASVGYYAFGTLNLP